MTVSHALTAWIRRHRRATAIGTFSAALALGVIAVALASSLLAGPSAIGQPSATASPSPDAGASLVPELSASAVSSASAGPSASAQAAPSANPETGIAWPPVGVAGGDLAGAWNIWAVVDVANLHVRSGPGPDHDVIGQLESGDLVLTPYGFHPDLWAQVMGDGIAGFVNAGPADAPFLLRTPTPWNAYTATLVGVASNGSEYLAYGYGSLGDHLILGGDPTPVLLFSEDGKSWASVEGASVEGAPPAVHGLAGGPTGWVALSFGHGGTSFVSFSPDGRTWEGAAMRPGSAVAYGPGGWVVTNSNLLFRSADGRRWDAVVELSPYAAMTAITGSDAGYVAYEREGRQLTASRDGVDWTYAAPPVAASIVDVDLVGDRVLAVLRSDGTGVSTLLRGILGSSGAVTWEDGEPEAIVGDAHRVHSIAVGPDGLLAVGWNVADLTPAAWSSANGDEWARLNMDGDALGGSVMTTPAWGAGGWVVLGTAPEGAGPAPRGGIVGSGAVLDGAAQALWTSTDGESWEPTATLAYEGPPPPCPPEAEVITLVLMYLGSLAGDCLGGASMTITGWVPDIQGLGGCCWPIADPQWLAGPYPGGFLAPARTTESIAGLLLYVPPGLSFPTSEPGTKLEVVGHFGDPAAATCRRTPDDDLAYYLEAPRVTRSDCAARFVVESVTAVDRP